MCGYSIISDIGKVLKAFNVIYFQGHPLLFFNNVWIAFNRKHN